MRVLGRDNEGVDDGWLCDRGRFGYQHVHVDERIVEPLVREGTELMPASWDKALAAASSALKKAGARTAALADGETTNEEAFLLQRLFREGLGSGHLASRPRGELPLDVARALASPGAAGLDPRPRVRARRAARRLRPDRRVADARPADPQGRAPQPRAGRRASARPTALDPPASGSPGRLPRRARGDAALAALDREMRASSPTWLRDAGEDIVIVYGDRALTSSARGRC